MPLKIKKIIVLGIFAFLFTFAIPYAGTKLYKKYNSGLGVDVTALDSERDVCIFENNEYEIIDCEEYIVYTLAGMYDEAWSTEMIKVMAVVLRTAIYYEMDAGADTANGGGRIINEGDLAEIRYEKDELREKWGKSFKKNFEAVYEGVRDTLGQVIKYNDKLIIPVYHQVSVGATVSAEEIYGTAVPYLLSVDSSQDISSPNFSSTKIYSAIRIKKEFGLTESETQISEEETEVETEENDESYLSDTLEITEATTSGFVKKVNVFGTIFSGDEFAKVMGLDTTNFHIDETDEGYRIISIGKGSSLGMSLYGAAYMAENGSTYEEIISYYYQGTEIKK